VQTVSAQLVGRQAEGVAGPSWPCRGCTRLQERLSTHAPPGAAPPFKRLIRGERHINRQRYGRVKWQDVH